MLDGTTWRLTVDVGREVGTWMPEGWAASGARLTLPMEVTFTDDVLPASGFFGLDREQHPAAEEIGASASKRMLASPGIFTGTEGVVVVNVTAGAWATWPTGRSGEHRLRFYLDFPDGAERKDVSIPTGRVYFDTACWNGDELRDAMAKTRVTENRLEALLSESYESDSTVQADDGSVVERVQTVRDKFLRDKTITDLQWVLSTMSRAMPERVGSVAAPKGNRLAVAGGLSIKAENGLLNMWGLLGETYYILGRFSTEVPIGQVPYPQFPTDWEG